MDDSSLQSILNRIMWRQRFLYYHILVCENVNTEKTSWFLFIIINMSLCQEHTNTMYVTQKSYLWKNLLTDKKQ